MDTRHFTFALSLQAGFPSKLSCALRRTHLCSDTITRVWSQNKQSRALGCYVREELGQEYRGGKNGEWVQGCCTRGNNQSIIEDMWCKMCQ